MSPQTGWKAALWALLFLCPLSDTLESDWTEKLLSHTSLHGLKGMHQRMTLQAPAERASSMLRVDDEEKSTALLDRRGKCISSESCDIGKLPESDGNFQTSEYFQMALLLTRITSKTIREKGLSFFSKPVELQLTGGTDVLTFVQVDKENPRALLETLKGCEHLASCMIQMKSDFGRFLLNIERAKVNDLLLSASEISYIYSQKLLLELDDKDNTRQRAEQEYKEDPDYSTLINTTCMYNDSCLPNIDRYTVVKVFGQITEDGHSLSGYRGPSLARLMLNSSLQNVFLYSLDGNVSDSFRHSFLWIFKSHDRKVVLESISENNHAYQIMDEAGMVTQYLTPMRPTDHTTRYDRQHILIMEDDPVVRAAAKSLYEKHPTVSTVYILENERPKLIKGKPIPLSEESRLVLVGHGTRDRAGEMRLGGYKAEEVAEIIKHVDREGDRIKTTSVVACEIGSNEAFISTLLKELHARSIETELHLRSSLVQVSHSGQKITAEITPTGMEERHGDDTQKVVAKLSRDGDVVIKVQSGHTGDAVYSNARDFLMKKLSDMKTYRDMWPNEPQRFVEGYARRAHTGDLEAFSWAIFQHLNDNNLVNKLRKPQHSNNDNYVLHDLKRGRYSKDKWITNREDINNILNQCYEIKSGEDIVNWVAYSASHGFDTNMYLILHDWIFMVHAQSMYVYPVGKRLNNNEQTDASKITEIQNSITEHFGKEKYPDMRRAIDKHDGRSAYADFARETFKGTYEKGSIPTHLESWISTYFLASVASESARNFRTFPVVLMALDMTLSQDNNFREKGERFLFEEHPMARGGSWVSTDKRGFYGTASHKGSLKLLHGRKSENDLKRDLQTVTEKEETVVEQWLRSRQTKLSDHQTQDFETIAAELLGFVYEPTKEKGRFLDAYQKFKAQTSQTTQHFSGYLGGFHDGPVPITDLPSVPGIEQSLKLSAHYSYSSTVLAEEIQNQLNRKLVNKDENYVLRKDSIRLDDSKFHCQFTSENDPSEIFDLSVEVPPEGQLHMGKISKYLQQVSEMTPEITHPKQGSKTLERVGTAIGRVGIMLGAQAAVHAFERGDTKVGIMSTLQIAHGITQMTFASVGKKIRAAMEEKVIKVASEFIKSPVAKRALLVAPFAGIGFGIYNIEEDIKRNDTLGYIDAGLDSITVALDVVESGVEIVAPELVPLTVPINLALSSIRMIIDDVYLAIQNELANLSPNAGLLAKIGAVSYGAGKGLCHFMLDIVNFFYTIPYREIEKGRKLVAQISDNQTYYTIRETEDSGRKVIDFAGGEASWNGGSICFNLSDDKYSEFCMNKFVSSDESLGRNCWPIETDNTQDIVVGIGESHQLTYQSIDIKLFMFIKVRSQRVVSGCKPIADTRLGTYYGNKKANNFFTVQKQEDKHGMEVMLDYYYNLYGEDGDDTFYLGPQRSYVEGRGGRDTYVIPFDGGNTVINNYDPLKTKDLLILNMNYCQISVSMSQNDVVLSCLKNFTVTIVNWFSGEVHRHLNMMSADGVLFEISNIVMSSVRLIARGVNMMSKNQGQEVDTSEQLLQNVINIMGSPYDDHLVGNGQKNLMDGGGGQDYMKGGEGEDIYVINERNNSNVHIDNNSTDGSTDMLIIDAKFCDFKAKVDGDNLVLMPFANNTSQVTLLNWFLSEAHRHLLMVTKDFITFTGSEDKEACMQNNPFTCLISQSIDYSKSSVPIEVDLEKDARFHEVTEIRGSNFNDIIRGNSKPNTIMSGRGDDFLQGRGGADWYVVTPGHGVKIINNHSPDMETDVLFLQERYHFIDCKCKDLDMSLFVNNTEVVLLQEWFASKNSQHLQVQSKDGVTFKLTTKTETCIAKDHLMIPHTVDFRNREGNEMQRNMNMTVREFLSVVEMYGSSGFDCMIGNANNNILDPFTGGAKMEGGPGEDIYIVKSGYGTNLHIDNTAEDEKQDTVHFEADFFSGDITVTSDGDDVLVSANERNQEIRIRLLNYKTSQRHQHLSFRTSDGVDFWVRCPIKKDKKSDQKPWIEAYKVTVQEKLADCHIDLSSHSNLSSVHTVKGCPHYSNHIEGNDAENVLFGGTKDDAIDGGAGHDTLIGGKGNDVLIGGSGDDALYGEEGNDTMLGGSGADAFIPGPGADLVDGGSGRDTVLYSGDHEKGKGVYVNLLSGECLQADAEGDALKDVENVIGTIFLDILVSGYEPALLKGSDGNDILVSVTGGDYLIGGEGSDIYMMVSHRGVTVIDNCAEDNSADVLYLPSVSKTSVDCKEMDNDLSLTFSGPDDASVEVNLKGWVKNSDECPHLMLILREGKFSVEELRA